MNPQASWCAVLNRFVRRKWGWYLTILDRAFFKVKILRFSKNRKLSNQYHHLRNELWLFLSGIHAGQWMQIPRGELHTYFAKRPTYVLEIQYGEKCVEEDIVRV